MSRSNLLQGRSSSTDRSRPVRAKRALRHALAFLMLGGAPVSLPEVVLAQTISAGAADDLQINDIGSSFFNSSNQRSRITQMAWTDGPSADAMYLFMASNENGIRRATYDRATRTLIDGSLVTVADIKGLGIAFDGSTLYATEPYVSSADPSVELSRIWKIEDFGQGARTAIVEGIPRQDHGVNHLEIRDHRLYVGIGVRTRNGVFQTWNGDTHGESAYGGSIGVIDDLRQVGEGANAAGFFTANPTVDEYRALIRGTDARGALPYTTTEAGKLRVHSSGTRNPFGLSLDGDGELWFTSNFHRVANDVYDRNRLVAADGDSFGGDGFQNDIHDQFFHATEKADYGYRNGNWQPGNAQGNTAAIDSGFFADSRRQPSFTFDNYDDPVAPSDLDSENPAYNQEYQTSVPTGLGPSASANGLAFYAGHDLPLSYHHDAIIARWNGVINDGGDRLEYRDVVSVDSVTGEVKQLASGFVNPLDVIDDGEGNLLVADWSGSIFLLSPKRTNTTAHPFRWNSASDGNWSDRANWDANGLSAAERMVPNAWGEARYAVTVDLPDSNPLVTIDRPVRIESLDLHDRMQLATNQPDASLKVTERLTIHADGTWLGGGTIDGQMINTGLVVLDRETLQVARFDQSVNGVSQWQLSLETKADPRLRATGEESMVNLQGTQRLTLDDLSKYVRGEDAAHLLIEAPRINVGQLTTTVNDITVSSDRTHISQGVFAWTSFQTGGSPMTQTLHVHAAVVGDANGDGIFNSGDLVHVSIIGEYEDALEDNSDWYEGDWDGDGDFTTSDYVVAFQAGFYSAAATPAAVPEPASGVAGLFAILAMLARWRRR